MTRLLRSIAPPKGVFQGVNFMTPTILGYYKLKRGHAELSTGTGMRNQPIYGVTIKGFGIDESDDRRMNELFQSQREALDYIEELSSERQ